MEQVVGLNRMAHRKVNHNDISQCDLLESAQQIIRDADLCVKCGLCLPHCPTYTKNFDEGDSPRGRIALAQGLASGQLPVTDRVQAHLTGCLVCRACESVCPSKVPYGRIIDAARAELAVRRPAGPMHRLLRWTATQGVVRFRGATAMVVRVLSAGRRFGVEAVLMGERSGPWQILSRAGSHLSRIKPPVAWRAFYPAVGEERGRVALFLGCVARFADRQTLEASIRLLRLWGYGVYVPAGQGCCGALYRHHGAPREAARLMRANVDAFALADAQAVVTTASGCGAMLMDYPKLGLSAGTQPRGDLARKVVDVSRFLADQPWPTELQVTALRARVAIHDPCTLRRGMGQSESVYQLLRLIPDLEPVELPGNEGCCGAGGVNMLTHPVMADKLAADKLDAWEQTGADILVTSNVGCALHLAARLRARGNNVEVLHPAVLLDRQVEGKE